MSKRHWVLVGWLLFTVALSGLAAMPTVWASPTTDELSWTVPTRTPTPTLITTPTPTSTPTVTPTPSPTPLPFPSNTPIEVEPNDDVTSANPVAIPGRIGGAITNPYDVDCFAIDTTTTIIGIEYRLHLQDYEFSRWLKVYDVNGDYVMGNTTLTNHEVELTLQATFNRYYLCVSAVTTASPVNAIADYLLEVSVIQPTSFNIFLPLVLREWPPPPPPIPEGDTVRFKGTWYDMPFEGIVINSETRTVLYDHDTPYYPQGIFVVVLMDVTNYGLRSDEVGQHNSFKAQDSAGRVFDLASLNVHQAAETTYQRESLYYPIQPGFTVPMVFVFDVLTQSEDLRLVAVEPW